MLYRKLTEGKQIMDCKNSPVPDVTRLCSCNGTVTGEFKKCQKCRAASRESKRKRMKAAAEAVPKDGHRYCSSCYHEFALKGTDFKSCQRCRDKSKKNTKKRRKAAADAVPKEGHRYCSNCFNEFALKGTDFKSCQRCRDRYKENGKKMRKAAADAVPKDGHRYCSSCYHEFPLKGKNFKLCQSCRERAKNYRKRQKTKTAVATPAPAAPAAKPAAPVAPAASGKRKRMPPKRFELLDMTPSQRLEKEKEARKKQKLEANQKQYWQSLVVQSIERQVKASPFIDSVRRVKASPSIDSVCRSPLFHYWVRLHCKKVYEFVKLPALTQYKKMLLFLTNAKKWVKHYDSNPALQKDEGFKDEYKRLRRGIQQVEKMSEWVSEQEAKQFKTQPKTAFEALKDLYRIGSVFSFSLFGQVRQGRVHRFNEEEVLAFLTTDDTGKRVLLAMHWQDYKDLKKLHE